MRRFLVLIVVLLPLALGGGSIPQPWNAGPPAHLKTVVDGNSTFAMELFARLKDREGNFFLSPYSISTAMAMAYGARTVDVRLPKFTVESRLSLTGALQAMGMSEVFNEKATFTGMTASRPLFINAVEHVAIAEVDEQGTVAAAATSLSFGCSASPRPEPATFHADHPFLFLIGDLRTHTILFLGRIANPAR